MAKYIINADIEKSVIAKEIYGNFAEHLGRCVYEGLWVGRDSDIQNVNGMRTDVVEALKKMKLPVLRWPGGCFADTYHWMDGVGDSSKRKRIVNVHWGDTVEDNAFGTDEFLELCRQIGCEPYICGNVGSGTVQEMQEWVEYVNSTGTPMSDLRVENGHTEPYGVKYWGVGNENWGCGGHMTPEFYADQYKRYAGYLHNYSQKLYKIACGANATDYNWTKVMMEKVPARMMDGLALHYYTHNRGFNNHATEFGEKEWASVLSRTLKMEELVIRHGTIMDVYDPDKKVALIVDEWGTWYNVEEGTHPSFLYMQDTMRDAIVAGINLNIFNNHSDRVRMANIAQLANVLQAVVLTDKEKMVLTPTFHVFEMYSVHQGATLVDAHMLCGSYENEELSMPKVNHSASIGADGKLNITLCNLDPNAAEVVECDIRGMEYKSVSGRVLTAPLNAYNDFDKDEVVYPVKFENAKIENGKLIIDLPAKSVVVLSVE